MGAGYFIEFPKLGIHLNISPIAFEIPQIGNFGPVSVHWYGIIIAAAILIALTLCLKQTKKFGIKEDDIVDMFLLALPVAIIFARLFFVVFTWDSYKNDLLGIFRIWEGGLAIYGAIIGAVLSVYIFTRKRKMDMLNLLDFACVYLPLAQAIGRWGNFTNQELYGTNTDLPWGMTGNLIQAWPASGVDGSRPVHPTFLYESVLNVIVFIILLRLRRNRRVKGGVFASYLMLYSFVRFMMEFLRTDEFGAGNIRYNQVFAAAVFIGALIWLLYLRRHAENKAVQEEVAGPSAYSEIIDELEKEEKKEAEKEAPEVRTSEDEAAQDKAPEKEVPEKIDDSDN